MSPIEHATVRRKLAAILEALDRLRSAAGLSLDDWMRDADRRDASKHRLQVCIEAAIDVNAHLLVGAPSRRSNRQVILSAKRRLAQIRKESVQPL